MCQMSIYCVARSKSFFSFVSSLGRYSAFLCRAPNFCVCTFPAERRVFVWVVVLTSCCCPWLAATSCLFPVCLLPKYPCQNLPLPLSDVGRRLLLSAPRMSVCSVGVGKADFSLMEQLDGDEVRIANSQGKKASRDIVQFVPMRDFAHKGFHALAKEVSLAQTLETRRPYRPSFLSQASGAQL